MREIIFRGKQNNGDWIEGDLLQYLDCGKWYIFPHRFARGGVEVDPSTVGQYIGIKDKNGKRIFEGDAVIVKHYNQTSRHTAYEIGVIQWDQRKFRFTQTPISGRPYEVWDDCSYEVIGNIHDNPGLMPEPPKEDE